MTYFPSEGISQALPQHIRPGELLVELQAETTLSQVLGNRKRQAKIRSKRISKHRNIYRLSFDPREIDLKQTKKNLESNPGVAYVQYNHTLVQRGGQTTPNDPLFKDQWYLERIGATTLWDKTTGGISPCGDTIVIAIFDFGLDPDHEDIQGQIWHNKAEIPNNSFDDDENGYVDDYQGLNLDSGDDKHMVASDYHGTRVASVIGSKSDNELGIAGLNWNIQLMILSSEEKDEATALEAFDYILDLRRRYNESNGADGAYVVAVNNSWGREGFFEEDFPILCGMFDNLGQVGVISVGSTENDQVNTDVFGDIPSDCSSDFLIVVTNTNELDELSVGGFGKENVDLGAPGESIRVADRNNGYGFDSGTSFAAPLVTGAVGLFYSLPEATFCDNAKISPQDASRDVKRFLLDGVTPIDDLADRTVSGGRLNLSRSADMATSTGQPNVQLIEVYPNPASDQFQLRFTDGTTPLNISVFDPLGRLQFKFQSKEGGSKYVSIDAQNWPSGHYFVQARSSKAFYVAKLLKL